VVDAAVHFAKERTMKTRLFVVPILVIGLLVAVSSIAAAQAPSGGDRSGFPPAFAPELTGPSVGPELLFDPEAARLWGKPAVGLHAQSAAAPDAPAVAIGQPGLSYRYARTFGETEVAYLADMAHVNFPYGIATDGANVWIGELFGHRAMKFTSTGTFVSAIGTAGSATGSFWEVADLAVDGSGNTWIVSGDQVIKFDAAGNEISRLWRDEEPQTHFNSAESIAFDSAGNVYISDGARWWSQDEGNHRIQVFDPDGNYLATIGISGTVGTGNLQFHGPHHIAIYNNLLYVADGGNHRVQIINVANPLSPVYVGTIGTTGESGEDNAHFSNPSGVAVDANYVYVADRWNNRVQIFARTTRSYVATLGSYGSENGQFWEPTDVAVDTLGNLYVADFVNTRVQQFDKNRTYVRTFGVARVPYLTDDYHYNNPIGVAAAPDGSLYIVEDNGHRLVKLNAAGQPQWTVGVPGLKGDWDNGNDKLDNPADVALDTAGRVYVADQWHGRIQVFSPDGSYYATLDNGGAAENQVGCPTGVTLAPNGYLYVTDPCSQRVQIFDRNLLYLATMGTPGEVGSDNAHFNQPEDVVVDSRGVIYVSDRNNHRVQVFNASRAYVRTIGETGVQGEDFDHLSGPNGLTVDAADRLYIADAWNNRVQVFDKDGAYLTTIAGSWGTRTGQTRSAEGVAVAPNGDVFVADWGNHRVQKFTPGVPGWRQVNVNGFGDRNASWLSSLLPFQGSLYAAGYPARIWRMTAAGVWSQVNTDGFGDNNNREIDALAEFDGQLYAATYNWVCDDANCNTGHSTSPQVWRSANGAFWANVTPAGGFGAGAIWVNAFVVFNNQLYMSIAGDSTRGAQVWRTPDGTNWTRVVENGFGNDVYNYQAPSLAVFNGNLYVGTGHGDWYDDGHPNGPLGGEVWRSGDGTTWVPVNASGFGTQEAYRVESLLVFRNGLYAYVSHMGGSAAGADVWRCTKTVCSEQGDWTKVMDNGFGVPQIQFLTSGAVSGAYLYASAVTYNLSTGMQLWRTANGTDWEKATPYDGLGNSNNSYAYRGAMIDFNGRLTLGVTNWANGAGIWQKTLTADFTAMPTHGAPPLTVQFTNTSAGDFTTSQWDFGDGGTSMEANPTHTYTTAGTYAVTLTVGDGTETSAITKPAYIVAKHFTYLPLVMRNWDPLLYDDFNDAAWDGAYNPAKWQFWPDDNLFQVVQQNGSIQLSNSLAPTGGQAILESNRPLSRSWQQVLQYQARLKISDDRSGGWSSLDIRIHSDNINGHSWFTGCWLGGQSGWTQAHINCRVSVNPGGVWQDEYLAPGMFVNYNDWHTFRIEADPISAHLRFYLDGVLFGDHSPQDAAALLAARSLWAGIVWGRSPNSTATRYVDDVRITPAR
jgi:PKD repeat protein